MIPAPTYLGFHLVCTLPAVAALWALAPRYEEDRRRRAAAGIAVLVAVAYAYTTPWIADMIRTATPVEPDVDPDPADD